jgi:hypothetical protein
VETSQAAPEFAPESPPRTIQARQTKLHSIWQLLVTPSAKAQKGSWKPSPFGTFSVFSFLESFHLLRRPPEQLPKAEEIVERPNQIAWTRARCILSTQTAFALFWKTREAQHDLHLELSDDRNAQSFRDKRDSAVSNCKID